MGGLSNLGSNSKSNSLLDRIAYVSDIRIKGDLINVLDLMAQWINHKPALYNGLLDSSLNLRKSFKNKRKISYSLFN